MTLKISDDAKVQMPMKTVVSLIVMVSIGTWAYFGIIETINKHQVRIELMEKDLTENTAFRIGWPRGTLGSLPADSEQFMLIEELYKQVETSMSACLKGKRVAERESKSHIQYQCIKSLAETEIYLGEKSIKKLILN